MQQTNNSKNTFFGGTVQTTGFNILYPLDDSTQQQKAI